MAHNTRERLIAETLWFVRAATGQGGHASVPGLMRLALIGSLATLKPDPQDIDLLAAVGDEADLAVPAMLGRKLKGRAQSLNLGADIFLANPAGHYIGRTCHWRRCAPGIRSSCDAWHCGERPYLHDDFGDLRLPDDLVAAPPIELWPAVVARIRVPQDVEDGLLEPLRTAGAAGPQVL